MEADWRRQFAEFEKLVASGRLRQGMTRNEVRAEQGEPNDMGGTSRRYRYPSIFKYGEVELYFGDRARDGLYAIFAEDVEAEESLYLVLPA